MENKNNKNLIIILSIIIILLVLAFGFYYYKNNIQKTSEVKNDLNTFQKTEDGREMIDVDNLVGSIKKDYKQNPQFKECVGMGMGIQSCLRDVIVSKVQKEDNVNLCNDLVGSGEKQSCVNDYYRQKGIKTGNEALCEKTSDKNNCLEGVLTKKAEDSGDETLCDKLMEGYKINCLQSVIRKKAVKTENPKLCDKLVYTRVEGEGENKQEFKETMNAEMCKEEVKMEIDMKKQEEKMKEEMKSQETKKVEEEKENN